MHVLVALDTERRLRVASAIHVIILRRVIIEFIKQWLKQKEYSLSSKRIVNTSTKASV